VNKSQNSICSSYKVIVSCHKIGTQTTQFIWISFTISLCTFWSVKVLVAWTVKKLRFHQKYLHLCSQNERKSYRFGMVWG